MVNIIIGFVDAADLLSAGLANLSPRTWHGAITQTERQNKDLQTPPASLPPPLPHRVRSSSSGGKMEIFHGTTTTDCV